VYKRRSVTRPLIMKALGFLISLGLIASSGKIINFDTATIGKMPQGWTAAMTNGGAPPKWEVLKDHTAPTQPYVLAQVSNQSADSHRTPLAILDTLSVKDGDISVRLKPVSGRENPGGGVVWRYQNPNNYYMARANAANDTIDVYKVENGRRVPLVAAVKHPVPINGWCILKVSAHGDRFQVYVDHRRVVQGQDKTFPGPGKVGLSTTADSVTYFDDFRVNPK
jgi:hypothetical protein